MTQSESLFHQCLRFIPGGVNSPVRAFRAVGGTPFFAQAAKGSRLIDVDGNEYIDYVCTWGPAILGHAPEPVTSALKEAIDQGTSFGVPGPRELEMAETICDWLPSVDKVRMCNSGTEATMSCVRLARGYTGRQKLIKFEGCYHGHVDSLLVRAGSGALTLGRPDSAGIPPSLAAETITLAFNDIPALENALQSYGQELAAVILEPIPANAGLILPDPAFLRALRKGTKDCGAVLIFDEVMTGFRLGRDGAQGVLDLRPDLSAFGKVIGGGLPVGAFGGKKEIMDQLAPDGPVYQAGTLSGNPLAMTAGLAQLHALEDGSSYRTLEDRGTQLENGVRAILEAHRDVPAQFYRRGSMFALFFTDQEVTDLKSAQSSDLERFKAYFHHMLKSGIYVPPSQFETNFISAAHSPEDIDKTLSAIDSFFQTTNAHE
jgi:glutamate-1-semialdehyde 2,1-aminomutase